MTRGAVRFKCSRTLFSSTWTSIVLLNLETPIVSQKSANRLGRKATTPQAANRWHPWVIPAVHVVFVHELQQFSLAHDRVGQVQPREFDLLWMIDPELVEVPVVERTVVFEFQRANRMRDPFDGIRLAVREVVHRDRCTTYLRCDDASRARCGT